MKEYKIHSEKSFIGAWFLEDLSLCDRMIEFFENSSETRQGEVIGFSGQSEVVKETKDSIDLPMMPTWPISLEYADQLTKVLSEYKSLYEYCNLTGPWNIEAVNIQKYNPAGAYHKWHFERISGNYPDSHRHLVFMTYLNDVEDSGETEFYYQQVKIKPQKGLTLIWPADWTHTHRGIPSPSKEKYIATGWFSFVS